MVVGGAFGVGYVLIGLLGFPVSGGHAFAGSAGGELLGLFMVNSLHNVAHLLIGALLRARRDPGRGAGQPGRTPWWAAIYLLLGVAGLFVLTGDLNVLSLNGADNALHFGSAAVLLVVGVSHARSTTRADRPRRAAGQPRPRSARV